MKTGSPKVRRSIPIAALWLLASPLAMATEGGGGMYPNGTENYMLGALPPPGVHFLLYASHYTADSLRDNQGNKVPVDFSLRANSLAPRVIWVTPQQILGGQLAFHAIAPLVELKVDMGGARRTKSGLGDMTFGVGLGYHVSPELHWLAGVDVNAPTGEFDKTSMANVGRNYWNLEPLVGISYVQKSGWNGDVKLMYDFNARNKDTDYRSGQELHLDFAAGWAFGNGWTAGVGGYAYSQTTDDTSAGAVVSSNRGRVLALGPSVKFDSGGKWFLTAKYEQEFSVRNRPQGGGLKLKVILPF
jgi:hypothetical protein